MTLSPWITLDDSCSVRIRVGGDIKNGADRYAFIDKTPRVRVTRCADYPRLLEDSVDNWKFGPKKNPRDWCDEELKKLGHTLLD